MVSMSTTLTVSNTSLVMGNYLVVSPRTIIFPFYATHTKIALQIKIVFVYCNFMFCQRQQFTFFCFVYYELQCWVFNGVDGNIKTYHTHDFSKDHGKRKCYKNTKTWRKKKHHYFYMVRVNVSVSITCTEKKK